MCCWNLTNLPDPPPIIGETESQFASSKTKPFQPVRLLTSLRDTKVKWSGTVILSELSRILSSSGLLRSLKCMVFTLGASSLDHALRKFPALSQKRVKDTCFTKPGLSLNFNARDSQKTKQYYLHHYLSHRNYLVIWHDVIKNSISRHRSNNNRKLSSEQLVNLLLRCRKTVERSYTVD